MPVYLTNKYFYYIVIISSFPFPTAGEIMALEANKRLILPTCKAVKLNIDPGRGLGQLVEDGKYFSVNPAINEENFSSDYTRLGEGILVDFNGDITNDQALLELKHRGLRPATMIELVAYGTQYDNRMSRLVTFALGSIWKDSSGDMRVGYLHETPVGRILGLSWWKFNWTVGCRALAVANKIEPFS